MNNSSDNKISKSISLLVISAFVLTLFFSSGESFYAGKNVVAEASVFNTGSVQKTLSQEEKQDTAPPTAPKYVIPMGTPFGIKLFTDGVIVASLSDVETADTYRCPARDAGIRPGDYIVSVNGSEANNNKSVAKLIGDSQGEEIDIEVRRGEEVISTTVKPVFSVDSFKTGMWIRDSAAGIGTLTFYDPQTGVFAGLGHGICDMDTNGVMNMDHGEPADISLCGIIKGEKDHPGQLQGFFSSDDSLGELLDNNETGIYGTLDTAPEGDMIEVAVKDEVDEGKAEILATVDASGPQRYEVQIEHINQKDQKTRNFVIKVTDERLLALTGGIVQGMSGSPVLQNGKLVGAVTHVFTQDPTTGYGIYASTMAEESVVYSMSK